MKQKLVELKIRYPKKFYSINLLRSEHLFINNTKLATLTPKAFLAKMFLLHRVTSSGIWFYRFLVYRSNTLPLSHSDMLASLRLLKTSHTHALLILVKSFESRESRLEIFLTTAGLGGKVVGSNPTGANVLSIFCADEASDAGVAGVSNFLLFVTNEKYQEV